MRCPGIGFQLTIASCLAAALSACGDTAPKPQAGPAPAVTVIKVAAEEIKPTVSFNGRVEAQFKVDLRARVDGFLEKRLFAEGADVKEGELLFVIEKGPYQAAVDQARAAVEKAQAALKLAEIEFDRQTELLKRNVGAQARVDEATAKQGEARGEMMSQKAALEKAELQLGYTDIRAPISGRIGRANIAVGNYVTASSNALATIVSQDPIYVTFPVTQREVLQIRREHGVKADGSHANIYAQLADGSRYGRAGKIDFIDVTVNQGTDSMQVRATFPNPERILIDGQLVTAVAETEAGERVLQVPQQALQFDQSGTFVLVVDKDDKVQVRRVEPGPVRDSRVVIRKGLEAGERVVIEGIQRVRPGQVVQPAEAAPRRST